MKQKKIRGTFTRTRRLLPFLAVIFLLNSCEVVRSLTTTSEYTQQDDKHVKIETKTTESYVGKKQTSN